MSAEYTALTEGNTPRPTRRLRPRRVPERLRLTYPERIRWALGALGEIPEATYDDLAVLLAIMSYTKEDGTFHTWASSLVPLVYGSFEAEPWDVLGRVSAMQHLWGLVADVFPVGIDLNEFSGRILWSKP